MARPAQHRIHHLAVLEEHHVLRAAGELAAVPVVEVRHLALATNGDRRPPQRVDVPLVHVRAMVPVSGESYGTSRAGSGTAGACRAAFFGERGGGAGGGGAAPPSCGG